MLLEISEEELGEHPLLYRWWIEHRDGLEGHELVFDFDSQLYKARPVEPKLLEVKPDA